MPHPSAQRWSHHPVPVPGALLMDPAPGVLHNVPHPGAGRCRCAAGGVGGGRPGGGGGGRTGGGGGGGGDRAVRPSLRPRLPAPPAPWAVPAASSSPSSSSRQVSARRRTGVRGSGERRDGSRAMGTASHRGPGGVSPLLSSTPCPAEGSPSRSPVGMQEDNFRGPPAGSPPAPSRLELTPQPPIPPFPAWSPL